MVPAEEYAGRTAALRISLANGGYDDVVYPTVGNDPYGQDGYKTIAYEICEQPGWRAPDKMVVSVGAGASFFGS